MQRDKKQPGFVIKRIKRIWIQNWKILSRKKKAPSAEPEQQEEEEEVQILEPKTEDEGENCHKG